MVMNRPVLVDDGKEQIHFVRDVLKVGWDVIAHADRLFPVSSSELADVGNCGVVQCPQSVFVKSFDALLESDLYAV
jgi:hypothetical protein